MQICSKINTSALGKYESGRLNYIFISRQKLSIAVKVSTTFWILQLNDKAFRRGSLRLWTWLLLWNWNNIQINANNYQAIRKKNDSRVRKEKLLLEALHYEVWTLGSFPLRISSVNVTKSAGNCKFGHIHWRNP